MEINRGHVTRAMGQLKNLLSVSVFSANLLQILSWDFCAKSKAPRVRGAPLFFVLQKVWNPERFAEELGQPFRGRVLGV